MELDLERYPTERLLGTYEFVFAQWVGGETSEGSELDLIPTVYIFKQLVVHLAEQISARSDSKAEDFKKIHNKVFKTLETVLHLTEEQQRLCIEELLIAAEKRNREIREEQHEEN